MKIDRDSLDISSDTFWLRSLITLYENDPRPEGQLHDAQTNDEDVPTTLHQIDGSAYISTPLSFGLIDEAGELCYIGHAILIDRVHRQRSGSYKSSSLSAHIGLVEPGLRNAPLGRQLISRVGQAYAFGNACSAFQSRQRCVTAGSACKEVRSHTIVPLQGSDGPHDARALARWLGACMHSPTDVFRLLTEALAWCYQQGRKVNIIVNDHVAAVLHIRV